MADNAPNSVNRPPYPNVVCQFNKRIEMHIATFSLAAGTPTIVTGSSTQGVSVAAGTTGQVVVTFPAGTTGSIGWVNCSVPSQTSPADVTINSVSTANNFVTGSANIVTMVGATATAVTAASITVQLYRMLA
jgi:hypothetical protein